MSSNDCPMFPYGRFNHGYTNLKLFPYNTVGILTGNPSVVDLTGRGQAKNIYGNVSKTMTKKEVITLLSKHTYNR